MSRPTIHLPGRPAFVAAYEGAWKVAQGAIRPALSFDGAPGPFLDAAFSDNIFQWDSCFIAFWAKYAQGEFAQLPHPLSCLDNFYALQDADGAIAREYFPDGTPSPNKLPSSDTKKTEAWRRSDAFMNPPLFSWAEWEYYMHTGDDSRLARVLPKLSAYFDWYSSNRALPTGHLTSSGFGCGMDNLPRDGAHGWIDLTAQAALDCASIANIALLVENHEAAMASAANFLALKALINDTMWDEYREIYSDMDDDGLGCGPVHAGCYWPLASDTATPERAAKMVALLTNGRFFARNVMVPAVAACEKCYQIDGGYWRGGVWSPTTYMILRGLANCGAWEAAHRTALNHVEAVAEVFSETGTIWEYMQPEKRLPGPDARRDFCGWSALGPIAMLIEFVLGIRVTGAMESVEWRLQLDEDHGIRNLCVGAATVSLIAVNAPTGWDVTVSTDGPVTVKLIGRVGSHLMEFDEAGARTFFLK